MARDKSAAAPLSAVGFGTGSYETVLVGAFSKRFVEKVDALYVRVRVTDVVGDSHERIGDCMKSARGVVHAPLD